MFVSITKFSRVLLLTLAFHVHLTGKLNLESVTRKKKCFFPLSFVRCANIKLSGANEGKKKDEKVS